MLAWVLAMSLSHICTVFSYMDQAGFCI